MANSNLVANPWILDTAGLITSLPIWISRIEWHPAAVDNDLEIRNANQDIQIKVRAVAGSPNNESIGFEVWDYSDRLNGEGMLYSGFDLETIDGGTLYVWRTV